MKDHHVFRTTDLVVIFGLGLYEFFLENPLLYKTMCMDCYKKNVDVPLITPPRHL